jgi:uncharacterized protein with HEPN domain
VRRDDERLADIVEAAEKISVRAGKGRQTFDADEDVQIVLVHLIQVIGEAASGLSDELTSEHPEVPWLRLWRSVTGSCTATSRLTSTFSGMWRSSTCPAWLTRCA